MIMCVFSRLQQRSGESIVREEDIESRLASENGAVALVLWPGVQYYTGQLFDMRRIVAAAHKCGAMIGLDLVRVRACEVGHD
jgi:kynureninase